MVGVRQARETLLAGFTTVRDIGNSGNYVDTELRMAVEAGSMLQEAIEAERHTDGDLADRSTSI